MMPPAFTSIPKANLFLSLGAPFSCNLASGCAPCCPPAAQEVPNPQKLPQITNKHSWNTPNSENNASSKNMLRGVQSHHSAPSKYAECHGNCHPPLFLFLVPLVCHAQPEMCQTTPASYCASPNQTQGAAVNRRRHCQYLFG